MLDRFSERAQRVAMLALYALGRQHEALARYRAYRTRLDEELGLEPSAETRALESADPPPGGRPLAASAPDRARTRARAGNAVRLLGRRAELDSARAMRSRAELDDGRRADPDRGRRRARQDATARRAAAQLDGVRVGRATLLASSSGTWPTCRSRPRFATRSRASSSTAERLPALAADPARARRSVHRSRTFDEVEVLEALVAVVAEHAPLVLAARRPPVGRPSNARRARLSAPSRRRPSAARS